jgi:cyclophilin family peptidyl-prolyl cis-trans isomerase
MADTTDKVDSDLSKVQKKNPFDSEENRKSSWTKSEKLIAKGKPEGALLLLRESDPNGLHATTLRLAGDATHKIAQRTNSKSDYRKAASLLRDSVNMNPKDKKSNTAYNEVLNEMQDKRISESIIPRLVNDGTPTVAGAFAFIASIIMILAALSLISNTSTSELPTEAYFRVTWTDSSEIFHDEVITITLFRDEAPLHVENLQLHAESETYDDSPFHRVIDGFMIQGGDFEYGTGSGGYAAKWFGYCNGVEMEDSNDCARSDWAVPQEHANGKSHVPGALAAAHAGVNTDGSQFYIVPGDSSPTHLDYTPGKDCSSESCHTVYGVVSDGLDLITSISNVETTSGSDPAHPVTLVSLTTNADHSEPWYQFW